MSSQRKPRTQRYSTQIRASQYDPDVDVNHHQVNTQPQQYQQQHQQQRVVSPRSSMDMPMPNPPFHDHYPVSSSSNNSASTTIINLTSPNNNSNNALPELSETNAGTTTTTGATSSPPGQGPSQSVSAAVTNNDGGFSSTTTPPHSSTATSSATPPPASLPSQPLNSSSSYSTSPSPSPLSIFKKSSTSRHSKTASQAKHPLDGRQFHHAKTPSVASVRSRLVARTSRSSLQLNLRTNRNDPNPTLLPTPSQSPGGTWDDPNLAPSPFYSNMDPAFLKEQELAGGVGVNGGIGGASGGSSGSRSHKESSGRASINLAMNRQDDGRLQLEQTRAYYSSRKLLTWTRSKLLLLLANTILLGYAVICTVIMTMSWRGDSWTKPYLDSGIMMIANHNVLLLLMVTAPFGVFVALLGYIGIFAQSRKMLTFYTVLLWPLFAMITSIGYITYRRSHVALYQKLKFSWINEYSRDDRLVIQNALSCCGYRSLGDYPSYDLHCFPRAPLPSCESKFLQYQQDLLTNTSSAAFTLLPIQLLVMIVALLCSNHIDNLFRTAHPITPKLYTQ